MTETTKRPHRTSMEGMIWHANHVLGYALRPGIRGIPKGYFMDCAGVAVLSVVEAGFIFSGNVGTGILMRRDLSGKWSNPVACGLTGIGFGFILGASAQELIIFFPDDKSIDTFCSTGVTLGTQSDVTVGVGRDFGGGFGASKEGVSATLSMAYSKGAFVSLALKGAVVAPRKAINQHFYESKEPPSSILDGNVPFPDNKLTLFDEVIDKLDKLAQGLTESPADIQKEQEKVEEARLAADKAAEDVHDKEDDVVEIDAQTEATKESTSSAE